MTTNAGLDKAALRRSMMAARKAVTPEQRCQWDAVLGEKLLAWWRAYPVASFGVYWPMQQEPDLRSAYDELHRLGVQLALPVVAAKDAALEFALWSPGDTLVKDAMGVSIPATQHRVACPEALLIPCLGYNDENFRLGYGGGFYDRTLAVTPRPLAIGIAYSFSKVHFEAAPHDVGLDHILTEAP